MRRLLPAAAKGYARGGARRDPLLVDEGNRAAAAAIQRIAAGEFELAGPFVLVGPPDSGKTRHLEELAARAERRGLAVASGTARQWTARFREALAERRVEKLTAELGDCDLLVIDEYHRLATSPATRQFLDHRIAERIERRRATAVATRHAPRAIRGIPGRAVSLLLGGFVMYLSHPGAEVRRRFLARTFRGSLTEAEIERYCAATVGGLGALRRALEARGAAAPASAPAIPVSLDRVVVAAARAFEVEPADLAGQRKWVSAVRAREAVALLADRLGFEEGAVAGALGGRGRTTVRRARSRAAARAAADPHYCAVVEALWARLASERRGAAPSLRNEGSAP